MVESAITLISSGMGFIVSLAWAVLLFILGRSKKDRTGWFYLVLYIPVVMSIITVGLLWALGVSLFGGLIGLHTIIIAVTIFLYVVERIMWGLTAREVAGKDKLIWFFLVIYVPLFGWLLYRATEAR